ncbi:MAG: hypothetical protein LBB21_06630 [Holosporaceae bacterium]|jgi:hypothetical protein|nr:hypothetical protein [Holosporaceae bacterium]
MLRITVKEVRWEIFRIAATVLSLVIGEAVFAMQQWPSMAIDGTVEHPEPKKLADFHASRGALGYYCFMPKDKNEMESLYRRYKDGMFLSDPGAIGCASWASVVTSIEGELGTRLESGEVYFINKFLEYLDVFSDLAANHIDKSFIGTYLFGLHGLSFVFVQMAWYAHSMAIKRKVITEEAALNVATELNKILNKTGKYEKDFVLSEYHF